MCFGGAVTDAYGNVRVAFHAHGSVTRHDLGLTYELIKEAGGLLADRDIDIDAEAIRPLSAVSAPSPAQSPPTPEKEGTHGRRPGHGQPQGHGRP